MKKLWVGILVLLLLLAAGIATTFAMRHIHSELSHQLTQAGELADTQWEQAKALADSARADWERYAHLTASLTDHEPLEEINSLFRQLQICVDHKDPQSFAMVCVRLAGIAEMLSESHSPCWWNLL